MVSLLRSVESLVIKSLGPSLAATSTGGLSHSRLFHITDHNSGMSFLVDTGADVSEIPPSPSECKHPHSLHFEAVNHASIPTYGTRSLTLNLGLRRTFRWVFTIAVVRKPIIGADFLHHFSVLVDIKHHMLRDGLTQLAIQGITTSNVNPTTNMYPFYVNFRQSHFHISLSIL